MGNQWRESKSGKDKIELEGGRAADRRGQGSVSVRGGPGLSCELPSGHCEEGSSIYYEEQHLQHGTQVVTQEHTTPRRGDPWGGVSMRPTQRTGVAVNTHSLRAALSKAVS